MGLVLGLLGVFDDFELTELFGALIGVCCGLC